MENQCVFHIFIDGYEEHEELVRRIQFVTLQEGTLFYWFERRSLVWFLSLNDDGEQRYEGIQKLELLTNLRETSWNTFWWLKCFNVFQTLKLIWSNKLCLDVKTFCGDMCFFDHFWNWQKDVNSASFFVSRSDTSTRTIATWAETLLSIGCFFSSIASWLSPGGSTRYRMLHGGPVHSPTRCRKNKKNRKKSKQNQKTKHNKHKAASWDVDPASTAEEIMTYASSKGLVWRETKATEQANKNEHRHMCVCGKSYWALGSIDLVAWTVFFV